MLSRSRGLLPDDYCVLHLPEQVAHSGRGMRHEQRVTFVVGADFFDGVEVLGYEHQHHDIFRGGSFDGGRKRFDGLSQSFHDGLALIGNSLPLQRFAFSLGFRLLHFQNLFRLAAGLGRDLLARLGVLLDEYAIDGRLSFGPRQRFAFPPGKAEAGLERNRDGIGLLPPAAMPASRSAPYSRLLPEIGTKPSGRCSWRW